MVCNIKHSIMKAKHLFPVLAVALIACNSNQEILNRVTETDLSSVSVIQPIEGLEIAPVQFKVNAVEHDTIFLNNGGSIVFDENSFVDKDGNPVSGEVDVAWQEFHSLADIAVSGIPMKYDSAGTDYDLVSGGMFTISASQGDKPVEIAPGKSATVNLVSQEDTPCYNFYELDEKTGDWSYETTKAGEKVEEESEVEDVASVNTTILDVKLNVPKLPNLDPNDIVGWRTERPLGNAEKRWLKENYSSAQLTGISEDGTFDMLVETEDKKETYKVTPYTMDEALADTKANEVELNQEMKAIEEYQKKLAQGKIVRSIEIENFGTYNWDIVCKRKNSTRMIADFEFPGKEKKKLISLFLISPDENAIVRYDANGDSKFSFDPDLRNCLIAILPNNELVAVDSYEFKRMSGSARGKNCTFTFKRTGVKLNSASDITYHLDKLI